MKPTLIVLSTIWACCALAQPTFTNYYSGAGTAELSLNELSSGNLMVGMAYESGTSLLDPSGNILHTQCYAIDTFLVLQAVKKYSDNEFFFVGAYWKDTCSTTGLRKFYPVTGRMDSLGNILTAHYYVLNASACSNVAGDLEVTDQGDVIAWGNDAMFFALRADPAGEVMWAKRFANYGSFQFIKELPSGDLLAGINMDTAGAVIARLDSDGNFIWCKSYIRPRGVVHDCLIESDSSFIITGYTDSIASGNVIAPLPPDYHPKLFMMKLDGAGAVQWCKGYDSTPRMWHARSAAQIVKAQDGNYVVLADLGVSGYNLPFRPFLMKTDQNGDTLWTRSAGLNGNSHDTYDLLACSDGGFVYNGQAGVFGIYLFKTDPQGHLPCHEEWYLVQLLDLFPTDSSFALAAVDGAIGRPASIDITTHDPVLVGNGCTITDIQSPVPYQKFRVYPNPNKGRFTVVFQDPLMAESYYSVYDAMGRLLYQRPLATGKTTEEVEMARFGTGTYVIKFTDPQGTCYERVVVE